VRTERSSANNSVRVGRVGENVGLGVDVGISVGVSVGISVGVGVGISVGVGVGISVGVGVAVGANVAVGSGVAVGTMVGVGVGSAAFVCSIGVGTVGGLSAVPQAARGSKNKISIKPVIKPLRLSCWSM